MSPQEAEGRLDAALECVKQEVLFGLIGCRSRPLRSAGVHDKTIAEQCQAELDERWVEPSTRLALCPAKEVLAALNRQLQKDGRKALSPRRLSMGLLVEEVADEMKTVLEDIRILGGELR